MAQRVEVMTYADMPYSGAVALGPWQPVGDWANVRVYVETLRAEGPPPFRATASLDLMSAGGEESNVVMGTTFDDGLPCKRFGPLPDYAERDWWGDPDLVLYGAPFLFARLVTSDEGQRFRVRVEAEPVAGRWFPSWTRIMPRCKYSTTIRIDG